MLFVVKILSTSAKLSRPGFAPIQRDLSVYSSNQEYGEIIISTPLALKNLGTSRRNFSGSGSRQSRFDAIMTSNFPGNAQDKEKYVNVKKRKK